MSCDSCDLSPTFNPDSVRMISIVIFETFFIYHKVKYPYSIKNAKKDNYNLAANKLVHVQNVTYISADCNRKVPVFNHFYSILKNIWK